MKDFLMTAVIPFREANFSLVFRYMVWRETISSTSTLGFRLEGIRTSDGKSSKDFKTTRTKDEVKKAFRDFINGFPHAVVPIFFYSFFFSNSYSLLFFLSHRFRQIFEQISFVLFLFHLLIQSKYVQRLKAIKATLEVSIFFSSHEVIGSSLLFVHDKDKANVWLIDFAKTLMLPDHTFIDHKSQWVSLVLCENLNLEMLRFNSHSYPS